MQLLHSTTIRAKLITVMTALILLIAGISTFAVNRLSALNEITADIDDHLLPATVHLGAFNASTGHYRRLLQQHILTATPEGKRETERRMGERLAEIKAAEAGYADAIVTEHEREAFEAAMAAWTGYLRSSERVIELSREGRVAEAAALTTTNMRDQGMALEKRDRGDHQGGCRNRRQGRRAGAQDV
jgi:methyl-accepting chemotaxis protein